MVAALWTAGLVNHFLFPPTSDFQSANRQSWQNSIHLNSLVLSSYLWISLPSADEAWGRLLTNRNTANPFRVNTRDSSLYNPGYPRMYIQFSFNLDTNSWGGTFKFFIQVTCKVLFLFRFRHVLKIDISPEKERTLNVSYNNQVFLYKK
jgi:hypothetical protein